MWQHLLEDVKGLPKFITGFGISYKNELKMIEKARNTPFQPVYEAFMNAWEAIDVTHRKDHHITLSIYVDKDMLSDADGVYYFDKIVVEDDGLGLNNENLNRLLTLRDDGKMNKNKGTGRVQYLHFFEETQIESVYSTKQGTHIYRRLTLSKKDAFVQNNAFVRFDEQRFDKTCRNYTKVVFRSPYSKDDAKAYASAEVGNVKNFIVRNFVSLLCDNRQNLPNIEIRRYVNGELHKIKEIKESDIVEPHSSFPFVAQYVRLNSGGKLDVLPDKEEFLVRTFLMPQSMLATNRMVLASKGAEGQTIPMSCMASTTDFGGKHYMFLVSGNYIEQCESDQRGQFKILTQKEVENRGYAPLLDEKYITIDDIRRAAEVEVVRHHPEVKKVEEVKERRISELVNLFHIDQKRVEKVKGSIAVGDSDETILRKLYVEESRENAEFDANLKQMLDRVGELNPVEDGYEQELQDLSENASNMIPAAQKNELSKYVVRRKLVLDLFDSILQKHAECTPTDQSIKEETLHNLIFAQKSTDASASDMWIINEEFIYFDGCSEHRLIDISINGEKLFDEAELSADILEQLKEGRHDRMKKRPDIFLYPQEGKCIIIEFKAPDVNVASYIHQIAQYATLIRSYSKDKFNIFNFYGYLIGQNINEIDVRGASARFLSAPQFDYWYRVDEPIACLMKSRSDNRDGNLYTEIIKYTTLLDRARVRNRIFVNKLLGEESK